MEISIVIPVYNGEEYIGGCLDAIVNADRHDITLEIIVVDDGSTDKTAEIATEKGAKVISLKSNMGRVVARKAGCEAASFEDVLFIDSRIWILSDALQELKEIDKTPVMIGGIENDKYKSMYETLFYLVRRKIYRPYFPLSLHNDGTMTIDKSNFFKAPKGLGFFYVKKELFLKSIPKNFDKSTNDDTKLLKNIVYEQSNNIFVSSKIKAEYIQRDDRKDIKSWIYQRGKMWADYYLKFINNYSLGYILAHFISIVLLLQEPVLFLFGIVAIFVAVSYYLSEEEGDFPVVLRTLPVILTHFYLGSITYLINHFSKKWIK